MGVRGLTTFIRNNEKKYLRYYKLHNCTILLDGNSVASNLFIWSNTESAFGGDYDKFAKYVKEFFKVFQKCEIKPLVIFDGGYEKQKLNTVYTRIKDKFKFTRCAQPLTGPLNFPLFMRIVFREVLTELKIPFAQSDFEADYEIAALARQLECPVLSFDSDFYIYDVLYIPFPSLCLDPVTFDKSENTSETAFYLNCKIYKVDIFINSFGGLNKRMLPLLAVLLGNDYIKRSVFKAFYTNLKIPKGKTNHLQRRIKAVIEWLRNETFESAVRKIMSRLKKKTRRNVKIKMKNIIKGYIKCSSILSEHLAITSNYESRSDEEYDIDNIIDNIDKNIESICDVNESVECEEELVDGEMSSESSSEDSDDEDAFENITVNEDQKIDIIYGSIECKEEQVVEKESVNEMSNENSDEEGNEDNRIVKEDGLNFDTEEDINTTYYNFPSWILEYARKGKIQSCVMDIISLRQHFFIPQVEDFSLTSVHLISLKMLSAIVRLLLGTSKPYVTYLTRDGSYLNRYTIEPIIETSGLKCPPCQNIMETDESIRKSALLDITENTLDLRDIPDEWHLFLIAVVFWLKNMNQPVATECHLHTLVMCIVCIYTIDSRVGVHRNKQTFMRKYKKYLNKILEGKSGTKDDQKKIGILTSERIENSNPKNELDNVTFEDCVFIFESVLPYHHLSEEIKTKPKSFSLTIVHAFSQFQSCLYHLIVLNSVLGFPFKETVVSHLFSGTFAYNMFTNLSKRSNVNVYTGVFFQSCPSLLKLYKVLVHIMESALSGTNLNRSTLKKQRKKKRQSKQSKTEYVVDNNTEEVEKLFIDENNRFSSLLLYT